MSALTLADAKAHLRIDGAVDDYDVQAFIDAAEGAITKRCGALVSTTTTATVDGWGRSLILPTAPVLSLTSVTPVGGSPIDQSVLYLDPSTGVVEFVDGSRFTDRRYTIVFAAGRNTVAPDLLQAVKELLRHLWMTQRGGSVPSAMPDLDPLVDAGVPGASYALPRRVEQLIAPYLLADL